MSESLSFTLPSFDLRANNNAVLSLLHSQWFANPEDEGRTEKPTPRRIQKAREEGKVAKSSDLTSAIVLLATVAALGLFSKYLLSSTGQVMIDYFNTLNLPRVYNNSNWLISALLSMGKILIPILVASMLFAVLANVVQFGFLFSTKPIIPDFKKIVPNFARFFQKSFGSVEAFYNLAKAIGKVAVVALIAYLNIKSKSDLIDATVSITLFESLEFYAKLIWTIMIESALFFLFLAIPDFLFQRKQHLDSLKMTKYDLKQEFKETEGDPLIKSRLKEKMRKMLEASLIPKVASADVVIVNPIHFAVALKYDRGNDLPPYVVAKGEAEVAQRIKKIASDHNVHIEENIPLARALYKELEVGDVIPTYYYEIVAEILGKVFMANMRTEGAR